MIWRGGGWRMSGSGWCDGGNVEAPDAIGEFGCSEACALAGRFDLIDPCWMNLGWIGGVGDVNHFGRELKPFVMPGVQAVDGDRGAFHPYVDRYPSLGELKVIHWVYMPSSSGIKFKSNRTSCQNDSRCWVGAAAVVNHRVHRSRGPVRMLKLLNRSDNIGLRRIADSRCCGCVCFKDIQRFCGEQLHYPLRSILGITMTMFSPRRSCLIAMAIAVACSVGFSACDSSQKTKVVELGISQAGVYSLQGREVPLADLKYELKALQESPGSVVLHIAADPMASFAAVGQATKAAQDAGIGSVEFVVTGPAK